ncbi:MAG: DinB family protein [Acidimicrobiia bacterium]
MDTSTLLAEAFRRIPELVRGACDGLGVTDLLYRPEPGANSIAWLVWHLSRVQDDHIAEIVGTEQVWADPVWSEMTGIDRDVSATGFGDTPEHVAAVIPLSSAALVAYNAAVTKRTLEYLAGVNDLEFDRIIDDSYDPPVSVGVRLVSVISDNLQHAGQARYLRGSIERLR